MTYQCKECRHIWSQYRGGLPNNCPNCGVVCTWNNTQQPDYGEETRKEYAEKQRREIFKTLPIARNDS